MGIYEKELLAVIHALDAWKHYLLGTPFIIRTNHQTIMTHTKLSNKQMRWEIFFSQFNFNIAHILGNHNQVAYALSRRPMVNAILLAHHHDLMSMLEEYVQDDDYASIIVKLANDVPQENYSLK